MGTETFITAFKTAGGENFERWHYKRPETCLRKQKLLFKNPLYKATVGNVIGTISVKKYDGQEYVTVMEG